MNPQQPGGLPPQQPYQPPQGQPGSPQVMPQQPASPIPGPERQYGAPQAAPGQGQYEFIMNPAKPKRSISLLPGGSLLSRIAIIGGGLVALIILAVILSSVFGNKGSNTQPMIGVAQDQTELVRVATLANSKAESEIAQRTAISVQLSVTSANQALLTYLQNNGTKTGKKQLSLKRDARTDTQLTSAIDSSNFDPVFLQIMQTQLTAYQRDLKAAYAANPGPNGKVLLESQYKAAGMLLTQTKQP
jgi:hypothetical protein